MGGGRAQAYAGVLRRPKLQVSPETIYTDPILGKFAHDTNLPGSPISRPTVHYVGFAESHCEFLACINRQIGAVLTMKASSTADMGMDGQTFTAQHAAPLNIDIRKVLVTYVDINEGDDWQQDIVNQLKHAFRNLGIIAMITMPLCKYEDVEYYQTSATVYLSVDGADNDVLRPSQLFFESWGENATINWDGKPPCSFCSNHEHLIMQCPERLKLICSTCRYRGHLAKDCARFGDRDRQHAVRNGDGPVPSPQ
ncbi:hypothetical protein BGZ72_010428, partial [Mortierella alpina]